MAVGSTLTESQAEQQVQKPQATAEKPREAAGPLAAGDAWTYRVVNVRAGKSIGTHEVRLVSAAGDSLVEEVLDGGGTRRVEHRRGFYLAPVGAYTSSFIDRQNASPITSDTGRFCAYESP